MAKKKQGTLITCTACNESFEEKEFGKSYSFNNRITGRLPICKTCCSELFDRLLMKYQDEYKALYRFCMMLDIIYSKDLANTTITNNRGSMNNIGLLYIGKMGLVQYRKKTFEDSDMYMNIFELSDEEMAEALYLTNEKVKEDVKKQNKFTITSEMIERWGSDFDVEDYAFLENRYKSMCDSYDISNVSNLWTFQEICMNYLLLRKERGNVQLQRNLQDINSKLQSDCKMKMSQIDNNEDENVSFGRFIDRIENYEPCEKKLPFFDDIDGIRKYIKRWMILPLRREWGLESKDMLEGEEIKDYQDINSIYKEVEEENKKKKEQYQNKNEDINEDINVENNIEEVGDNYGNGEDE